MILEQSVDLSTILIETPDIEGLVGSCDDNFEAFAIGDKLEKLGKSIKELVRDDIDKLKDTIEREHFKIRVAKVPKYVYIDTHELITIQEEVKKKSEELKSLTGLVDNIKKKQVIDGVAIEDGFSVRATVL